MKEPKESKKYQEMLAEVEGIVAAVGSGEMDLDQMVTKIERGYGLIRDMRERLESTKAKVERLRAQFDETVAPS